MNGWVLGLSSAQLDALRANPSLVTELAMAAYGAQAGGSLDRVGPFEQALDLGKSWHILHFLFAGGALDSETPCDTLLTGEDFGDDLGYGPARLHGAKATQDFARFLEALDVARLCEQVNYRDMSDGHVYGIPFGPGPATDYEAEVRADVSSDFPRLRDYVVRMAEKQACLLIWLS